MVNLLLFCLVWLFFFIYALAHFSVKLILWLKLFYRQEAGRRRQNGESVVGRPHRVLFLYSTIAQNVSSTEIQLSITKNINIPRISCWEIPQERQPLAHSLAKMFSSPPPIQIQSPPATFQTIPCHILGCLEEHKLCRLAPEGLRIYFNSSEKDV